jgi:MOSC domain-containing protein YiiM
MSFTITSIQIGSVISEGNVDSKELTDRYWTTGFYKRPVDGAAHLKRLGIEGDAVADTRNHGGPDKAVLCYAAAHYDRWREELPELSMSPGALAENLTVTGVDESSVYLGDTYLIGDCEVQVSQPRQPCWKIARRWGLKTLTKRVAQTGRTGWYFRVIRDGSLQIGQVSQLLSRPHPDWPVQRANDVMFGREVDRLAVIELMQLPELAESWKGDLA